MTDPTPHRATPEQWHRVLFMESLQSDAAAVDLASTVCELRARVEALEVRDREDSDAWTGVRRANSELRAKVKALEAQQEEQDGVALGVHCELYARVEALEAQEQVQLRTAEETRRRIHWLAKVAQQQDQPPAAPEPDDSPNELVKQVANVFVDEEPNHESDSYFQSKARSQIRVVARWLRANGFDAAADRLEQEAGR